MISEECFDELDAPIRRVNAPHTPVPFSPALEKYFVPNVDRVIRTVKEMM
jgi:pyruvate/2-oxoglutarate/acetoin dehydrogenase E1 component